LSVALHEFANTVQSVPHILRGCLKRLSLPHSVQSSTSPWAG